MSEFLGLIILSLVLTFILIVPFIDFLYKVKLKRQDQKTMDVFDKPTPLFDKFHRWKVGTPFGGGILIICVVSLLSLWSYGLLNVQVSLWEVFVLLFTFIGFGLLGLYDDIKKLVGNGKDLFWAAPARTPRPARWWEGPAARTAIANPQTRPGRPSAGWDLRSAIPPQWKRAWTGPAGSASAPGIFRETTGS